MWHVLLGTQKRHSPPHWFVLVYSVEKAIPIKLKLYFRIIRCKRYLLENVTPLSPVDMLSSICHACFYVGPKVQISMRVIGM